MPQLIKFCKDRVWQPQQFTKLAGRPCAAHPHLARSCLTYRLLLGIPTQILVCSRVFAYVLVIVLGHIIFRRFLCSKRDGIYYENSTGKLI